MAGDIIILWREDGWFWVIPFADGTTSVGVVGDPATIQAAGTTEQERFDRLCAQTDVHRSYFGERRQLDPLRRHADYSFACRAKIGDRFLLMGDASGFIDPIFSTGVFIAQMTAFEARDVISPVIREDILPDAEVRRAFENKLGVATRRYLTLIQQFYDTSAAWWRSWRCKAETARSAKRDAGPSRPACELVVALVEITRREDFPPEQ